MARLSRDNINLILEYACDDVWVLQLDDNDNFVRRVNRAYGPIGRILTARIAMPCIFLTIQQRLCVMHRVGHKDGFWVFSTTEPINDELSTVTIYAYQYTNRSYSNLLVDLYCMISSDFASGCVAIEPTHIGMSRYSIVDAADDIYSWQIQLDI